MTLERGPGLAAFPSGVYVLSWSLLGPVVPSLRDLSGRLQFTFRHSIKILCG